MQTHLNACDQRLESYMKRTGAVKAPSKLRREENSEHELNFDESINSARVVQRSHAVVRLTGSAARVRPYRNRSWPIKRPTCAAIHSPKSSLWTSAAICLPCRTTATISGMQPGQTILP